MRGIAYIFYRRKLEELKSSTPGLKMFSTDAIGWHGFDYQIVPDVNIRLESNFGYGQAAYMRIVLRYKGVRIVAYSMYVNYYYANARDLARYTRNYSVSCWSWDAALQFVESVSNLSLKGEQEFAERWIYGEIRDMIVGLHTIAENPRAMFDKWTEITCGSGRILLDVREVGEGTKDNYKCFPDEMILDFQAEKISGALDFLDSLEELKPVCEIVDDAVSAICTLAVSMVPAIQNGITDANEHLSQINKEIQSLLQQREFYSGRISYHKTRVKSLQEPVRAALLAKNVNFLEIQRAIATVEDEYHSQNPDWGECDSCFREINDMVVKKKDEESSRRNFLDRLKRFLDRIDEYKELREIGSPGLTPVVSAVI